MTPEQFKEIRLKKGFSIDEMAQYLGGKSTRIIFYYESGERPVARAVVRLLEALGDYKVDRSVGHLNPNKNLILRWRSMKNRCYTKSHISYPYYGGRGVEVCKEWLNNYFKFESWALSSGYKKNLTLDRIDNNKSYEPSNCRWISMKLQHRNRSNNRLLSYQGEEKTLGEWSEIKKVKRNALYSRIYQCGWTAERALETPVVPRRRKKLKNKDKA